MQVVLAVAEEESGSDAMPSARTSTSAPPPTVAIAPTSDSSVTTPDASTAMEGSAVGGGYVGGYELVEQHRPARVFVVLTSEGVQRFWHRRPIDELHDAWHISTPAHYASLSPPVEPLFLRYGRGGVRNTLTCCWS